MYRDKFLSTLQQKIVHEAITPGNLGYQQELTEMHDIFNFAKKLDLAKFSTKHASDFKQALDDATFALSEQLSAEERTWGTARTALNFFLKDALYNRYLSEVNDLFLSEHFFETPINDTSIAVLQKQNGGADLPEWSGLPLFTSDQSNDYQAFAADLAKEMGVSRVHLGLFLWPGWQ